MINGSARKVRVQAAAEPVYVFGSSLSGIHGDETAEIAMKFHGAKSGTASGRKGNSYAIPVLDADGRALPLSVIRNYVDSFLSHAEKNADESFFINHMGRDTNIASLFRKVPKNCMLPGTWVRLQRPDMPVRLILEDLSALMVNPTVHLRVDQYLGINLPLWNATSVEIVSAGLPQSVVANDKYARSRGYVHRIIGENRALYGHQAAVIRDAKAVWYATHLLNLTDPMITSRGAQIRLMSMAAMHGVMIDDLQVSNN